MNIRFITTIIALILWLSLDVLCDAAQQKEQWGLIVVPVTDVLGSSPNKDVNGLHRYNSLPFSWESSSGYVNTRIHQLLFNEVVKILEERFNELKVEVQNLYIQPSPKDKKRKLTGWIKKDDLINLNCINQKKNFLKKIPKFSDGYGRRKTVVLKCPHKVKKHNINYSAGTRFVIYDDNEISYTVYILDPSKLQYDLIRIPKSKCLVDDFKTPQEKLAAYLKLIKYWSNCSQGSIAYLLGGASWTKSYKDNKIASYPLLDNKGNVLNRNGSTCYAYTRKGDRDLVKSGLDCSSLIYMAAQAVGIPYYCKNTTTIINTLKPLTAKDKLEDGDLLVFPGHVMVLTTNNGRFSVIQAEGYASRTRLGKVKQSFASDLFKGVKNSKDLINLYLSKKPLVCFDHKGNPLRPIQTWGLYKFSSCWGDIDNSNAVSDRFTF